MRALKAIYDGHEIKPLEPIIAKKETEVIIIFPDDRDGVKPSQARKLLRGSAKGKKLVEKLLKSRDEDRKIEEV